MGIFAGDFVVTKDNEVIYRKTVGFSDYENTKPLNDKNIFWCFSATKVITCAMALRLVEEGRLDLDAPVSDYLPEYADVFVKRGSGAITRAEKVMKVRHLFSMSTGLDYNLKSDNIASFIEANPDASTREVVKQFVKAPLHFEPGTSFLYSLSHDVLAAVCEVVTGMRFSEYLEKYLFTPLGMTDTGFRPTEEQKSRFVAMHRYRVGVAKSDDIPIANAYMLTDNYDSGGAGLFSTASDYSKFISTLAAGGVSADGYRLLKPETIALMQKNEITDDGIMAFATTRLFGYGWGLCGRVHMNPAVSLSLSPVGEFGWDGAAGAFVMADLENNISIFFAMHTLGCVYAYNVLHPLMRNLVYKGIKSE
jgi:CubicO group peptidase (beta-lactamase class C family)